MPYKPRLTPINGANGDAITGLAITNDSYLKGNAIIDGLPQNTDVDFKIKIFSVKITG